MRRRNSNGLVSGSMRFAGDLSICVSGGCAEHRNRVGTRVSTLPIPYGNKSVPGEIICDRNWFNTDVYRLFLPQMPHANRFLICGAAEPLHRILAPDRFDPESPQKQHHVAMGSLSLQFDHDRWEGYPEGIHSRLGASGVLCGFSSLHLR